MKFISLIYLLTIVACVNNQPKAVKKDKVAGLKIRFEEGLKMLDSTFKVDSFKVLHIDTLTERDKLNMLNKVVEDSLQETNLRMEALMEFYKSNTKLASMVRISKKSPVNFYKTEAEKIKRNYDQYDGRLRNWKSDSLRYDSLLKICDTIKPIGYEAICLYQVKRKDHSVIKDTTYMLMNLDKSIVRREDFLK